MNGNGKLPFRVQLNRLTIWIKIKSSVTTTAARKRDDLMMRKGEKGIHTWIVDCLIPHCVEVAQRVCCVDEDVACIGAQNCVCWPEASNIHVVEKMSAGVNNIQCKHKFMANLLLLIIARRRNERERERVNLNIWYPLPNFPSLYLPNPGFSAPKPSSKSFKQKFHCETISKPFGFFIKSVLFKLGH